jgi:hypothetical protein
MALRNFLILRCLAKRGLEGRTTLLQLIDSPQASFTGATIRVLLRLDYTRPPPDRRFQDCNQSPHIRPLPPSVVIPAKAGI